MSTRKTGLIWVCVTSLLFVGSSASTSYGQEQKGEPNVVISGPILHGDLPGGQGLALPYDGCDKRIGAIFRVRNGEPILQQGNSLTDLGDSCGIAGRYEIGRVQEKLKTILTVNTGLLGGKNFGVKGSSFNDTIGYGGHFVAEGSEGVGVYGCADKEQEKRNYGGYFQANGMRGFGVYGRASYAGAKPGEWEGNAGGCFESVSGGAGVIGKGRTGGMFESTDPEVGCAVRAKGRIGGMFESTDPVAGCAVDARGRTGGMFESTDPVAGCAVEARGRTGIFAKGKEDAGIFQGRVRILDYDNGAPLIEIGKGVDFAEGFDLSDNTNVTPGMVLAIDPENPGSLRICSTAYDTKVAGIVAGAKGLGSGVRLGTGQFDHFVALAGRVYCNVDATEAPVEPGDLLTTSATAGYAMKVSDHVRAQGAILGKAMERLKKGQRAQILVLVTLQ